MSEQEPEQTRLEPHVLMPRGGVAPRCQRRKKNGHQCSKPARAGYRVCPSHGARYGSREASGERQKPGRPITTGVYSSAPTRSYAEAAAEVASLTDALTSSDRDLIALKAVLALHIAELEAHGTAVEKMEATLEALPAEAAEMDLDNIGPEEAMRFARRLAQLREPIVRLDRLTSQVAELAVKSTTAHKSRAETRAKLSQVEGIEVFLRLLKVQMQIVRGLSPNENYWQTYQIAVQREISAPNRLEAPPLDPE